MAIHSRADSARRTLRYAAAMVALALACEVGIGGQTLPARETVTIKSGPLALGARLYRPPGRGPFAPNQLKIYPATGRTAAAGHDFIHRETHTWEPDVFAFLSDRLR